MNPTVALLLAFSVFMAGPSLGCTRTRAQELPEDTNTIESLTPEQAEKLAQTFPGVDGEVDHNGSLGYAFTKGLPLNGLKTIDAATAEALSQYNKGPLLLNGLTTVCIDAAKALVKFDDRRKASYGALYSPQADKAFANYEGNTLHLDGLATLSPDTAEALVGGRAKHWVGVLSQLDEIDPATAKVLAEFEGPYLWLAGVVKIDADTANALADFKGDGLYLNSISTIDMPIAKALANVKAKGLALNGLTRLNADAATALAVFKGNWLDLNGLQKINATTVKAITGLEVEVLRLKGLTTIEADAAEALADLTAWDGQLPSLTALDAEAAMKLAAIEKWKGQLPGIDAFKFSDSVSVAAALATRKGRLAIPNLKRISPKTLAALLKKEDVEIPLIETLELIQEPDGSVTEDFVIPEGFQKGRQRQGR